nr:reverse transcriptase domain-containing protein [Tanacetum cinerariifolium]
MDQLIQQVLSRLKVAGRLQKWSIELGEYGIHYRPRISIKGQILVDFIVERPEEDSPDNLIEVEEELPEPWILFTNGSSCTDGSGAGLILTNPEGMEFTYALRFRFDAINNEAKYEALIAGLWITEQMGVKNLQENVNSRIGGQPKRANRSLREGIKARLDARRKNWMEELPHVLWEHRTMIKSSNGDTLFSLTYETEAVIPVEIDMPTLRTAKVDLVKIDEALGINLDLLEEIREQAAICEAKSKTKMEKYYNSNVRSTSFKPGDLVYRNNYASRVEDIRKLGPKWEGPYKVMKALGKGGYKLRDRDRKQLP